MKVLSETADERVELQEFRYTRVKVTRRKAADGTWTTAARDLADARLNPWWFSHDSLYTPANDGTGGPFTIGRVIHSSRSVGFTGWIGGVAVFNRALSAEEIRRLSEIRVLESLELADGPALRQARLLVFGLHPPEAAEVNLLLLHAQAHDALGDAEVARGLGHVPVRALQFSSRTGIRAGQAPRLPRPQVVRSPGPAG